MVFLCFAQNILSFKTTFTVFQFLNSVSAEAHWNRFLLTLLWSYQQPEIVKYLKFFELLVKSATRSGEVFGVWSNQQREVVKNDVRVHCLGLGVIQSTQDAAWRFHGTRLWIICIIVWLRQPTIIREALHNSNIFVHNMWWAFVHLGAGSMIWWRLCFVTFSYDIWALSKN